MDFTWGHQLETSKFFSGGAGMFLQFHDIVQPVYLMAIIKYIINNDAFGLPIDILKYMGIPSLVEWYMNRRYINPLQCLDINHQVDIKDLDDAMQYTLKNDSSIYKITPALNIKRMLIVYKQQYMSFPIFVYTEKYEEGVERYVSHVLHDISITYVHGDLKAAISKCDQNFTYIFSDIELANKASNLLAGTYSNLLIARDYRYNYKEGSKSLKYDLKKVAKDNLPIRIGTTTAITPVELMQSLSILLKESGGK